MRSLRSRLLAVALAAALGSVAPRAAAEDLAAAEALFQEAKALSAEGRWSEACPKFGASHDADPSVGTLLNWADCLEKEGRLGSSLARFREAEIKLQQAGDARSEVATERRAALEERAPRLSIRSPTLSPPGILVLVGGEPVDASQLSPGPLELLVDPGPLAVEIRRGDRVLERRDGLAKEGVLGELELDLAAIARAHPEEAPPPSVAPPPGPSEEPSAAPKVAGWILVGTGGAALLTAGALELVAASKQSDAEAFGHCRGALCSPVGYEETSSAGDLAEAGQWVGIAGVGLLAVGITLVLTAPSAKSTSALASPSVRVGAGPGRVALDGSF